MTEYSSRQLSPVVAVIDRLIACGFIGAALTVGSTYVGGRMTLARYPDIDGCVTSCSVVTTGWPFPYVVDYPGMTMPGVATLDEVWFAADRFLLHPFLADVAIWSLLAFFAWTMARRQRRPHR